MNKDLYIVCRLSIQRLNITSACSFYDSSALCWRRCCENFPVLSVCIVQCTSVPSFTKISFLSFTLHLLLCLLYLTSYCTT